MIKRFSFKTQRGKKSMYSGLERSRKIIWFNSIHFWNLSLSYQFLLPSPTLRSMGITEIIPIKEPSLRSSEEQKETGMSSNGGLFTWAI